MVSLVQAESAETTPVGKQVDMPRAMTALGRCGTIGEGTASVAFLASPAARPITGTAIMLDSAADA